MVADRPQCDIPRAPVKVSVAATSDVPILQYVLTLANIRPTAQRKTAPEGAAID